MMDFFWFAAGAVTFAALMLVCDLLIRFPKRDDGPDGPNSPAPEDRVRSEVAKAIAQYDERLRRSMPARIKEAEQRSL